MVRRKYRSLIRCARTCCQSGRRMAGGWLIRRFTRRSAAARSKRTVIWISTWSLCRGLPMASNGTRPMLDPLRDLVASTLGFFERFGVQPTPDDMEKVFLEEVHELI